MRYFGLVVFIAMLGFVFFSTAPSADNRQGMFVSYGVKKCASVIPIYKKLIKKNGENFVDMELREISGHPELRYIHGWLLGFATAINSSIHGPPNFFKGMKEFEIINWTVNWCKKNPGGTIDTAIRKLATQIKP